MDSSVFVIPPILSYLAACFVVLAGIWALFDRAEVTTSDDHRKRFGKWLKDIDLSRPWTIRRTRLVVTPTAAEKEVDWASSFPVLFDHVFGDRHFSVRCASRSLLTSLTAWVVVVLAWLTVRPEQIQMFVDDNFLRDGLSMYLTGFLFMNLVPDYVSLLETRALIGLVRFKRRTGVLAGLLVLDIVLTISVFLLGMLLFLLAGLVIFDPVYTIETTRDTFVESVYYLAEFGLKLDSQGGRALNFGLYFYSAFFTSLWLWLYYATLVMLFILRLANRPWQWILQTRDLEGQPYRSLGFMANAMLVIPMIIVGVMVL